MDEYIALFRQHDLHIMMVQEAGTFDPADCPQKTTTQPNMTLIFFGKYVFTKLKAIQLNILRFYAL